MILCLWKTRTDCQCLYILAETHWPKIRLTAQVGFIIPALPAFDQGRVHYRALKECKISSLKSAKGNGNCQTRQKKFTLVGSWFRFKGGSGTYLSITMWIWNFLFSGFGFCFKNKKLAGSWSAENVNKAGNHINQVELLAIFKLAIDI